MIAERAADLIRLKPHQQQHHEIGSRDPSENDDDVDVDVDADYYGSRHSEDHVLERHSSDDYENNKMLHDTGDYRRRPTYWWTNQSESDLY